MAGDEREDADAVLDLEEQIELGGGERRTDAAITPGEAPDAVPEHGKEREREVDDAATDVVEET